MRVALFLFLLLFSTGCVRGSGEESWVATYGGLLKKYVRHDGVRYEAWRAHAVDAARLVAICDRIGAEAPTSPKLEDQLAYYINAYNAWVLRGLLEAGPVSSIREIAPEFGFFNKKEIRVAGEAMTLNHLEKEILIARFHEPRVHFAINCASRSCPPLAAAPFTGAGLEAQLDQVTTSFFNGNREAVRVAEGTASISMIFNWYRADFERAGGVLSFINRYRDPDLPEGVRLEYLPYDWDLNSAR